MEFPRFCEILRLYSKIQPRFAPDFGDENVLRFWYGEFGKQSPAAMKVAFDSHVRGHDAFPTVRQLAEALGIGKTNSEGRAIELPHLVWSALETHHSNPGREDAIRRMVGDDGLVLIARLGGWRHLLNISTNAVKPTLIAQWRDVAKAITPELVQAHLAEVEQAKLPSGPARATIEAAAQKQDTTHYGSRKGTPETMAKLAEMRRSFRVVR